MSVLPGRRAVARVLQQSELAEAAAVCARAPVASVLAASRIAQALRDGLDRAAGQVWGYPHVGPLRAVCWSGANIVPVVADHDADGAADAFAAIAADRPRRASSIVGEQRAVLRLWATLRHHWSVPRDVRRDQPSMVIDRRPDVAPDPGVARSTPDELALLFPACVRMFTEEVGYSPVAGSSSGYEERVRQLIAQGRSFRRVEDREVVFKAEIGALANGVAQIQGVWVPPHRRGLGLAAPGVAAVVEAVRTSETPVVSLYVNHFNVHALAAYRRVGFEQVGTYATVLF